MGLSIPNEIYLFMPTATFYGWNAFFIWEPLALPLDTKMYLRWKFL